MKVTARISDKNLGYAQLKKRLGTGKSRDMSKVGVGLHADKFQMDHPTHGKTFGVIGTENEFGTTGRNAIPPRPFVRQWFDAEVMDNIFILRNKMYGIVDGTFPDLASALKSAGDTFAKRMRSYITVKVNFVPNAKYTVKKKGRDFPLVETGQLVAALTAKVDPTGRGFQ